MPLTLVGGVLALFWWWQFHPDDLTQVDGPAGSRNRAFIDPNSFPDISLILCAADWPFTFWEPFRLGDLYFPQAYTEAKIFWSMDGSVLAFRVVHRGETTAAYVSAYDYQQHTPFYYRHGEIEALIKARGGLGPQFDSYSERKGN